MTNSRRVLLCGKSLFISGLQASLEGVPGLELQLVEPQPDRICDRISEWQPHITIVEGGLIHGSFFLSLLLDFPWMKLIALDIEDNRMLVFSGQSAHAPTTFDLLKAIEA